MVYLWPDPKAKWELLEVNVVASRPGQKSCMVKECSLMPWEGGVVLEGEGCGLTPWQGWCVLEGGDGVGGVWVG